MINSNFRKTSLLVEIKMKSLFSLRSIFLCFLGAVTINSPAIAQVIEDRTLGTESSAINLTTRNNEVTYRITGGALRGRNLFHSFEQFSVPENGTALFPNTNLVENIIGRVTGANVSKLEGLIQVEGGANLFLINPTGIFIGPNARLEMSGSFLTTTGQGFRFDNGFIYDAFSSDVPPLLTINAPIGLMMGNMPGDINIVGQGNNAPAGLGVASNKSLSFIGGNISLTGAKLTTVGGRLELGSVSGGDVDLLSTSQGFDLSFDKVSRWGDIQIAEQSILDASGIAGGAIELQGQNVRLVGQSAIISDTLGDFEGGNIQIIADIFDLQDASFVGTAALGAGAGGNISILGRQAIRLIGTDISNYKLLQLITLIGLRQVFDRENGGIFTNTTMSGRAGDINFETRELFIDNGVSISAESFGLGRSGDIDITAEDNVFIRGSGIGTTSQVPGIALADFSGSATGLSAIGIPAGAAGNVTLKTQRLVLDQGAAISAATVTDAPSGKIVINASESIELRGFFEALPIPTSVTTSSIGGRGTAGDVQIETGRLTIRDGSQIFTSSGNVAFSGAIPFGGEAGDIRITARESVEILGSRAFPLTDGVVLSELETETLSEFPAGDVSIITPSLIVRDGGRITSSTLGSGQGGDIKINANLITLSGTSEFVDDLISGIFSTSSNTPEVLSKTTNDGIGLPQVISGDGGALKIQANNILVENGAAISVGAFDLGNSGNVEISANQLQLNQKGRLAATTTSGEGGNISLNIGELLQLRRQSLISATVGGTGNGGNIDFTDGIILAVPGENSDIIANAFEGRGGRISLSAQDILGLTPTSGLSTAQLRGNTTNDISASSELGIPGEVRLQNLAVNPEQGLAELPGEPLGGERLIGQNICATGNQKSEFVSTGRGGIPLASGDALESAVVWWETNGPGLDQGTAALDGTQPEEDPDLMSTLIAGATIEATHWNRLGNGQIALLPPMAIPRTTALNPASALTISCPSLRATLGSS